MRNSVKATLLQNSSEKGMIFVQKNTTEKSSDKHGGKSSVISCFSTFGNYVYSCLKTGLFGAIFTSYRGEIEPRKRSKLGAFLSLVLDKLRRKAIKLIDTSFIAAFVGAAVDYLLRCALKVYGVIFFAFGIYSAVAALFPFLTLSAELLIGELIFDLAVAIAAIPLMASSRSLSEALVESRFGRAVCNITGIRTEAMRRNGIAGRANVAFVIGIALGAVTYFISPIYVLLGIFAAVLLCIIAAVPEFGVVTLFFAAPLAPTMALVALVAYVLICFTVKLLRGKRVLRFEKTDVTALAFAVIMLFGGLFSVSSDSLKPSLVYVAFILGYFLAALMLNSREWLTRATVSAVLSAVIVAVYGIADYYIGDAVKTSSWLDSNMFGSISGRAVSTLDNPNMLGEYLILIMPMAFSLFVAYNARGRRFLSVVAICSIGACLVLTWSRGAWLGLLVAMCVYAVFATRKSLLVFIIGVFSLPFWPAILPQSVWTRIASVGNTADSSTMYRVNIWRGTVDMLKDHFFSGIGVGEGAWREIYPSYALSAIEAAPHSHNIYLQITVELGIVGLAVFLILMFMLAQSCMSYFKKLSDSGDMLAPLKDDRNGNYVLSVGKIKMRIKNTTAMRLEAAAPFCGVLAVLAQGLTDHIWYNYRVYLMFWLVAGLVSAYARLGDREISFSLPEKVYSDAQGEADELIPLIENKTVDRKNAKGKRL